MATHSHTHTHTNNWPPHTVTTLTTTHTHNTNTIITFSHTFDSSSLKLHIFHTITLILIDTLIITINSFSDASQLNALASHYYWPLIPSLPHSATVNCHHWPATMVIGSLIIGYSYGSASPHQNTNTNTSHGQPLITTTANTPQPRFPPQLRNSHHNVPTTHTHWPPNRILVPHWGIPPIVSHEPTHSHVLHTGITSTDK